MAGVKLDDMTLPELLELIRMAVDEVEIRAMQEAGESATKWSDDDGG